MWSSRPHPTPSVIAIFSDFQYFLIYRLHWTLENRPFQALIDVLISTHTDVIGITDKVLWRLNGDRIPILPDFQYFFWYIETSLKCWPSTLFRRPCNHWWPDSWLATILSKPFITTLKILCKFQETTISEDSHERSATIKSLTSPNRCDGAFGEIFAACCWMTACLFCTKQICISIFKTWRQFLTRFPLFYSLLLHFLLFHRN